MGAIDVLEARRSFSVHSGYRDLLRKYSSHISFLCIGIFLYCMIDCLATVTISCGSRIRMMKIWYLKSVED